MSAPIDLVVTCTDRKSVPVPDHLRLREVPLSNGRPSASEWISRLETVETRSVEASSLYQGELWTCSLELLDVAARLRGESQVRLWVLSAGYGLVPVDAELKPYSATFSPRSPDFVGRGVPQGESSAAARSWWKELGTSIAKAGPGSLTELAHEACGDLLIALSAVYLDACLDDLKRAAAEHSRTIIISTAASDTPGLDGPVPPFDARLLTTRTDRQRGTERPIFEGTRVSLNARVAKYVLEQFGNRLLDPTVISRHLADLNEAQPKLQTFPGQRHEDDELLEMIRERLNEDPETSKTRMLSDLRLDGHKCEQKRFGRLFRAIKEDLGHPSFEELGL